MIRGITFDKQLMQSQDHAHEVNYYYGGLLGVTKGCTVAEDVDGNLVVSEGYFIIKGRLVGVQGSENIVVPDVASGVLYSILVFEIDLTQTNTTTEFNQGAFKILSNASAYPTLTQQDLDDGGTLYQFEFARFENTVGGIVGLIDNRILLDISRYLTSSNFGQKINALTEKTTPVNTDMVVIADSASSDVSKKLTWANIKATLKTYFDTIYPPKADPTFTGTQTLPNIVTNEIKFPAIQVPSADPNTLDDYEEGAFTPTITSSGGTFTTVSSNVRYIKIGKLVTYYGSITITNAGTAIGTILVTTPFPIANASSSGIGFEANTGVGNCGVFALSGSGLQIRKYDGTTIIASDRVVAFSVTYGTN